MERSLQHFLAVEILPQIDVKYLQAILRHRLQEQADALPGNGVALGQGAEADRLAVCGEGRELFGIRDVVPGYVRLDLVLGNPLLVQGYLHRAGGILHAVQVVGKVVRFQRFHDLLSQGVLADGAHRHSFQAELAGVIGKVGGGAAQFLSFGKHIPKRFPYSDNEFTHDYLLTLLK